MTLKSWLGLLATAGALTLLSGCGNIGSSPSGGSDAEVKAAFDKLPLDAQVKSIMSSPAPADQKEKRIREIYAKAGKEVPADMFSSSKATSH